jgi:hypothetical protein
MTSSPAVPAGGRAALRLHLTEHPGEDVLDGGWWPQGRDLAVELADLLTHFAPGRFGRALVSAADWSELPEGTAGLGLDTLPDSDTHVLVLEGDDARLRLLVVPPELTPGQGEEALLAAASRGNSHSAASLLRTVTEHEDVDPRDHWS